MLLILTSSIQPQSLYVIILTFSIKIISIIVMVAILSVLPAVGDPSCANAAAPHSTESPSFITLCKELMEISDHHHNLPSYTSS